MLALVVSWSCLGCEYDTPVGFSFDASPDEPPPDASPPEPMALCHESGVTTVIGRGPDGTLVGYHGFASLAGTWCDPALEIVLSPEDPLTLPMPERAARIEAAIPVELLGAESAWFGAVPARVTSGAHPEAVGELIVHEATPYEPGGAPGSTGRVHATARFDDGPWQFEALVELPYCRYDGCP